MTEMRERFDQYISTEDQSGVPKGLVRMRMHRADGTVDTQDVLMPSFDVSDAGLEDIKKIEAARAYGALVAHKILVD